MAEEQKKEAAQGGGKKKLLLLGFPLLLILGGGGAAAYFFLLKKTPPQENVNATENATEEKPKPPPELEELSKPGIFIDVGEFVVNLADTDVQRFVKVSVTLEVMNEKVQNDVNQMMPAIKDAINDLISSKYYRDVRTPEGRERLKIELLKRLNALLPEGGIKAVYFTQFVVQTM
ncbi:MAG TPA: flagellar basal body-associated FliL family protein [Aquifex aeolicus]|uniref:Flagellar protein FliL n=1 Tax=Aquifex aeolicus TaxID=63363 RepID=A0A9D0YRD2_AQUAO|nr:flagellar basal body-associated FliL family protein [Aquificales bacterium]HIP98539.1 flagellar basal body-associated FliL family protein [Aquifex aeolicus]HIQ26763.1 flagellar basal body-associated FliL family protein [Aquifex aeolicus]